MSRVEHDIERGLTSIADRATPSPDAWAQIQSRIADQDPIQETEIIMLTDNTLPTRRWPLLAAAAAVIALVIGGLALITRYNDDPVPADNPPPTDVVEPEPETGVADPDADAVAPVDGVPVALPTPGSEIAPGGYVTDAIGVPIAFELQDGLTAPWTLVSNDEFGIQLISDDTGREFIAIGRIGSWFDAEEARAESTRGLGNIPADGIDTWIATNGVIVVESADTQVGGRDAKYRLIRLDTTPGATADFCPSGEAPCLWAVSGSADLIDDEATPVPFGRDRVQAIWSIDMGEFEPLFIFAAANLDDDGPWFTDVVQPIVDSIELGEPGPVIEGGTARVAVDLPAQGTRVEPGRYTTDVFGVTATFDIPDVASTPWTVFVNNQESIVLGYPDQTFVSIKRIGSFYDADQAQDPAARGLGSIAPDDIDQWIEVNGIDVLEQSDLTIAGRNATYHRFTLPADAGAAACPGGTPPCLHVVSSSADQQDFNEFPTTFQTDLEHSIWMVELDGFEPLGIAAYTADGDHQAWIGDLMLFLDSVVLSEPAPAVEDGTARLS